MMHAPQKSSTKLSETPLIHPSAEISDCTIGRYTEIYERCHISESSIGDYSYIVRDSEIWCATIGKFVNIASHARINAPNHPTWRASLHHFTYRAENYWPDAEPEADFFEWRRQNRVTIGHDVWLGHGVTILPGVNIGNGAVIGAGAVVTRDVAPYRIMGGVPAKPLRWRFAPAIGQRMDALAWWDWSHDQLRRALADFRTLKAEAFLDRYEAQQLGSH